MTLLSFLSVNFFTLKAQEKLSIASKSKAEKYCMDQWQKKCSKSKLSKVEFLTCTKEQMGPKCKAILTELIKKEVESQKERKNKSKSEQFQRCHQKLTELCPAGNFAKDVDRAKCFQQKFSKLDEACQEVIKVFFARPNNKK